jgi:DNA-nicking Smr family endonuclease
MKSRPPRSEERTLWRAAMKGVSRLASRPAEPREASPAMPSSTLILSRPRLIAPPQEDRLPLPPLAGDAAPGLDRRSAERLRRGALPIEARLDLHGLTQDEAHGALVDFVARSATAGRRCVLVITGKGVRGSGVLRSAVPRWLNEAPSRRLLLAFAPAQPKDGGSGALYLLLRRRR